MSNTGESGATGEWRAAGWIPFAADPAHVARERAKARELRKSGWWKSKISAGKCHWCGKTVGAAALTLDHIVPLARGGRSTRGNCVPACRECNAAKNAVTPAERTLAALFPEDSAQ